MVFLRDAQTQKGRQPPAQNNVLGELNGRDMLGMWLMVRLFTARIRIGAASQDIALGWPVALRWQALGACRVAWT